MAVTATTSTLGTSPTGAVTSPGIGSGLDVNTIVAKLMSVEQQPLSLLDKKQASYKTDLSAYGSLKSLFSSFQGAMKNLADPANYQGLSASSSDSTILTASAGQGAAPGSYSISVANTAQAQVLAATGITSLQNPSSTGTLTLQAGSNTAATITIDSSNNTLAGLRDAINAAGAGITATIVNDGSATPYKLVLSANATGASNTIQITNNLGAGELHDAVASLAEVRAGKDAALTVNGVSVKSASNSVTTVIPGITLNLNKAGDTALNVSRDTSTLQAAVGSFVNAYNNVNGTIAKLTAFDATTKQGGPLLGDSLAQSLQTRLRSMLGSAIPGTGSSLTTLSQIGVSFQKDGSLSLDSSKLSNVMASNFPGIAALFSEQGKSGNSLLSFISAGDAATAGDYQVNITTAAAQAAATAANAPAVSTVIDNTNDGFAVTVDGTASGNVTLTHGTYTATQLASALQTAINSSSALKAAGASVSVAVSGGKLAITSASYGSTSKLSAIGGTGIAALGFNGTENGVGTNVAGSFTRAGVTYTATGVGQVLTAAAGSGADSMSVKYTGTAAQLASNNSITLNYAEGYASRLYKFAGTVVDPDGSLAARTDGLNKSIADLDSQRDAINRRLTRTEANYRAQFASLDTMISSLNQTSSFLTQQLANLTASTSK